MAGARNSILLLSAAYPPNPGGVATHVSNLAHGLAKDGRFYVYVIASTEDSQRLYPNRTKTSLRLMIWSTARKQVEHFSGRRVPCQDALWLALRKLRDIQVDLIHAHDFDSIHVGMILGAAFRAPLVTSIHRAPMPWRDKRYFENAKDCYMEAMRCYNFADAIVVPSTASREILLSQGFESDIVRCIPHGINENYLSNISDQPLIIEENGISDASSIVFCPTRSDTHKDYRTFIEAASYITKSFPDKKIVFWITCDPDFDQAGQFAENRGLAIGKNIIFKPLQRTSMATLYRRAKVCVIPSRRESFGQTVLESFVYRTPVVVANTSALKEIVQHGENGLLFTDGEFEDLAQQILRIHDSNQLAQKLITNGIKSIRETYNAQNMVEEYTKLYLRLLYSR